MKKFHLKSFSFGLLLAVLLFASVFSVLAATGTVSLEATYRDIQIFVNGTKQTPTDVNGNIVEPFIVNGTTYLPVRAISEALDKTVAWDAATNSVLITDKKGGQPERPSDNGYGPLHTTPQTQEDPAIDNSKPETAGTVKLNDKLTGWIGQIDQSGIQNVDDWYWVTLGSSGTLRFSTSPVPMLAFDVYVYSEDGKMVIAAMPYSPDPSAMEVNLSAGNYPVLVRRTAGDGKYVIENRFTPLATDETVDYNADGSNAGTLVPNRSVTGVLGYLTPRGVADELDVYKISLPSTGRIRFLERSASSVRVSYTIRTIDGKVLDPRFFEFNATKEDGTGSSFLLDPGEYFVEVRRILGVGSYEVAMEYQSNSDYRMSNVSNSTSTAASLSNNVPSLGVLGAMGPTGAVDNADFFTFTLDAPARTTLDFTGNSRAVVAMSVYDSSNTLLATYSTGTTSVGVPSAVDNEWTPSALLYDETLPAGTYYVRLDKTAASYATSYRLLFKTI